MKEVYIISETIGEFSDAQTSLILAAKSLELAEERMAKLKLQREITSECVYLAMDIWRSRKPKGGDYSQVDYIAWIDQALPLST
jgi:hypothetical protein